MPVPEVEYQASVKQFTETETLEVVMFKHPSIGELVNLVHRSGSLSFQFPMTPDQALELAGHLIEASRVPEGEE